MPGSSDAAVAEERRGLKERRQEFHTARFPGEERASLTGEGKSRPAGKPLPETGASGVTFQAGEKPPDWTPYSPIHEPPLASRGFVPATFTRAKTNVSPVGADTRAAECVRLKGTLLSATGNPAVPNIARPKESTPAERTSSFAAGQIPEGEVFLHAPPEQSQYPPMRWMLVFAPLIGALLLISMLTLLAVAANVTDRLGYIIGIILLFVFGITGSAVTSALQINRWKCGKNEEKKRYLAYLRKTEDEWKRLAKRQIRIQTGRNPSIETCITIAKLRSERLWERKPQDEDFLCVRAGLGSRPFCLGILTPPAQVDSEGCELDARMRNLADGYQYVSPAPVLCDFSSRPLWGIVGPANRRNSALKDICVQAATFHSSAEVEIVFSSEGSVPAEFASLGRLPHVRQSGYASKPPSEPARNNVFYELEKRAARSGINDMNEDAPFYMVVLQNVGRLQADEVRLLAMIKERISACAIVLCDSIEQVPQQIDMILNVEDEDAVLYSRNGAVPPQWFRLDTVTDEQAGRFAGYVAEYAKK
jgi:S-DNA-T family DNA segregation ATPase FtsK/SpoIIIE